MADLAVTAFTGHLWIVGGRAVRVPPPGALAESAPRRVPRVREGDNFCILVAPDEHTHAPAPFFESLAQLAADTYFGSSSSITSGLRDALTAINEQALASENGARVHALAVVLRGAELTAARSGRMFSVLLQWPTLIAFPTDRRDPLIMNLPPLGAEAEPDIQLTRYTVAPGQAMLIADPVLNERTDDELRGALSAENVAGMLDKVKALAGPQTAASVMRFMAPDVPDSTGSVPQPSERAPQAAPRRVTPPPQPALVDEPPPSPVTPAPVAPTEEPVGAPPTDSVAPFVPDDDAESDILTALDDAPASVQPFPPDDNAAIQPPAPDAIIPGLQPSPDESSEDEKRANPLVAGVQTLLAWLRPAPVDDDSLAPRKGPSALHKATVHVRRTTRDVLRGTLTILLTITSAITRVFDRLIPTPDEEGRQGIPTNVAVALAVLIPLVIVIAVVGLALSEQGKGEFQIYLDRAKSAHSEALTLSGESCDNPAHRLLWVEVLRLAEQAGEYRPNDQDVLVISADARNYLDCFDMVERRELKLLYEFANDAELVGPIVNGGVDIYTLDRKNGRVYHAALNETGDGLTTRNDRPIVYTGQVISSASGNFVVGELIDIEWLTAGGTAHDNVLIALDKDGQLIAYSPTFFASAQKLVTEGRWVRPVALAVFRSNIYVLDAGANQIWRYLPPAGVRAYPNAPEEYFNGDTLPDLENAVDLGISEEGAVYVLFADGMVKRYRRNAQSIVEEQPFDIREAPSGALQSGVALFVDNDPLSRQLYIVDPETDAIYETLWGGKFRRGYRPRNLPDAFDEVSGIYADAVVRNNMYVVAGNKLYQLTRNR